MSIATLQVVWLEYNARSLNGRIYPKSTCDAIFQAAQRKILADDLPATVFVSHEAANSNCNTELVGKVAKVWQDGNLFWANLELTSNRAAWDMLNLVEDKVMRAESMRVSGVELKYDPNYEVPIVVPQEGAQIDFLGIDFTTRPGLADVARIKQILYESTEQPDQYIEEFAVSDLTIESRGEQEPTVPPAQEIIVQDSSEESIDTGETPMTPEEMLAELAKAGYTIQPPKTEAEKLQEALDAKLAEQRQQLEEAFNAKLAALQPATPPARQTLSNSQQLEESTLHPEALYQVGDYLQESLQPKNWRALSNRQVPWPAGMHPKDALRELAPFMAVRLLEQDANAQGKNVEMLVRRDEQI